MGARRTPARPAISPEMAQAMATTRPALTPSSSISRRLSTAARIWRPRLVSRIRTSSAARITTVVTTVRQVDAR